MFSESEIFAQIVACGRRLWQRGMVAGSDGNISARLDGTAVAVTPSGVSKGWLHADRIPVVDLNGQVIGGTGKPSSELAMHLAVYRLRPEIGACVHAHPPCATGFAVAGRSLPEDVLPEIAVQVGPIPLARYAPPGTAAVAESLRPHLESANAFLLQNHGVLTLGRDIEEAVNRLEAVEQFATILLHAITLGGEQRIPSDDMARLRKLRDEMNRA